MATNSNIEWTDTTWNPVVGCSKVSEGCKNCYAMTMAKRLAAMAGADIEAGREPGRKGHYINVVRYAPAEPGEDRDPRPLPQWNNRVECVPEALTDPLRWKKPRRVFVNSMSDLFHEAVPSTFIVEVFATMYEAQWHTFQVLTKRPERMAKMLGNGTFWSLVANAVHRRLTGEKAELVTAGDIYRDLGRAVRNVWLGTSVENQATADERIPHLLKCPAAVRFLSMEPLLGAVNILPHTIVVGAGYQGYHGNQAIACDHPQLHWVIVGGESGKGARPMHPDWARSIRDQCQAAGVPFFFKQWGEWGPVNGYNPRARERHFCFDGPSKATPLLKEYNGLSLANMFRWGKKAAGRLLDGRTWDEFPQVGGSV